MSTGRQSAGLFAVSDLHVAFEENKAIVEGLRAENERDWLCVAGDVSENLEDFAWTLGTLAERYARVVWVPGNHDLWTHPSDPTGLRGEQRYLRLVEICRELGVVTPEDPYPVWQGEGGPATIVPLFLLYDYTFLPEGSHSAEEALRKAYEVGVVCTDEMLLHPDPHPGRADWCAARLAITERRLADRDPTLPTVLVNHFPLIREPTRILRYPEFAQWCGTERTADWHITYDAAAVVYGHLHVPRTTWHDGVPFEEVSLGYPREWRRFRGTAPYTPRRILPAGKPGTE